MTIEMDHIFIDADYYSVSYKEFLCYDDNNVVIHAGENSPDKQSVVPGSSTEKIVLGIRDYARKNNI